MPNRCPRKTRKEPWTPPRGIFYREKPDRPKPFIVWWRDPETKKVRSQAFADEADRETAARKLAEDRADHGKEVLTFDPEEWRLWRQFRDLIGDADPLRVAHEWLAAGRPAKSMTVPEAIDRYMALRVENGLKDDSFRQLRIRLQRRFSASFSGVQLHQVEPQHLRDWLKSLKHPKTGEEMQPETKCHHLASVRVFFNWAQAEGLVSRNPVEAVHPPTIERKPITVITVEQITKLFEANRNSVCIGRLALEAFGGLRYSTAARVTADSIRTEEKALILAGKIHKSGQRHYIDGHPANLWAWLAHAPAECWTLTRRNYLRLKSEAFKRAGIPHPHNILRHSFASYHLALCKDAAKTAYLLQHRGQGMLYRHYNGGATSTDAAAYFAIVP